MADEKDILNQFEKLKHNRQFSTPDGYFEGFADKLMNTIEEQENPVRKVSFIKTIKPQLALAASFAALFLIAYTTLSVLIKDNKDIYLSELDVVAELEKDIYSLDEEYLYELAFSDTRQAGAKIESIEITQEDILQYLMEENDDIDLLINDL